MQPRIVGKPSEDKLYRAVYLTQRSLKDLVAGIATKLDLDPSQILQTVRVSRQGLNILFDDEMVREMPEGQDMTAEFHALQPRSPKKREWDAGPTDTQVDGDFLSVGNVSAKGYELRVYY